MTEPDPLRHYREVWLLDFEFRAPAGERPRPVCMVAKEFRTGAELRLWADDLATGHPPFSSGAETLVVAYYASAEFGCFRALDWPMPARVLDLFCEFRCLTNGLPVPCGNGLLGALAYFGLASIEAAEKDDMRALAMREGPHTAEERSALLGYCATDVDALARLLPVMLPRIDLPRALLRGRYLVAAARMEWCGTPIDAELLEDLRTAWTEIQSQLVAEVDREYGVFVPTGRKLDPESRLGAAILRAATDNELDPHVLAEAVDVIWAERRAAVAEQREALIEVRKATGLTSMRVAKLEDSGFDSSSVTGLDVKARSLASEFPELGLGRGYEQDAGADDTDYAGDLWQLLRADSTKVLPKYHPEILDAAVRLVSSSGTSRWTGRMSFNAQRWAEWLIAHAIAWPRLESGVLDLSDDAFRMMAKSYPEVAPIRELRHTLSQLRLNDLAVGSDGRNRCLLSAFRARTGRNQPSNSRFIFGPSCWLRGLIKPAPGRAIAYVDWSQQEFGIAAALSGDRAMMAAYSSGDPYLTFAKQAGAVPPEATKQSHPRQRELFKVCALAVQYGMGAKSLAFSLGMPEAEGRELLRLHRKTYPRFWQWSEAAVSHAMLHGWLQTVFGWRIHIGSDVNPRSLANFPVQGNGAEMLRLACCLATERGISVCAPVHDALLVEGADGEMGDLLTGTQAAMAEASRAVLWGFELRSDAEVVRWPDRYMDERGRTMWETVLRLLGDASVGGTQLCRRNKNCADGSTCAVSLL